MNDAIPNGISRHTKRHTSLDLKMLLPKLKPNLINRSLLTRLANVPRRRIRPAKVHAHLRLLPRTLR